jgi:hypothetical protein
MGGKSGSAPPPVSGPPDNSAMNMQMMQMMAMMMNSMPQAPGIPALPDIIRDPDIDWLKLQDDLRDKMRADYKSDQEDKKGRSDTIHTDSLLDNDVDPNPNSLIS